MPAETERLDAEIVKNLGFELCDAGELRLPRERRSSKPVDLTPYEGLFFARADRKYGRIDYAQHCLSAFLKLHAEKTAYR